MTTSLRTLIIIAIVLILSSGPAAAQQAGGTAWTYQGQLTQSGSPVTGTCDFQFALYDAASSGSQVGSTLSQTLGVDAGLFITLLDFGASAWSGDARYLDISVRCPAGSGSYTTLTPRQQLSPTPYAIRAGSVPWSGVSSIPAGFADGVDADTTYSAGTNVVISGTTVSVPTFPWSSLTGFPLSCDDGSQALLSVGVTSYCTPVVTRLAATNGITRTGTLSEYRSGTVQLTADTAYLQRRVSGTCPGGSSVTGVASDGTVTCGGLITWTAYSVLPGSGISSATDVYLSTVWDSVTLGTYTQSYYVATTNNSSNYWTLTVKSGTAGSSLCSFTTSAGAANVWGQGTATCNSAVSTTNRWIAVGATKTGSPGTLYLSSPVLSYSR